MFAKSGVDIFISFPLVLGGYIRMWAHLTVIVCLQWNTLFQKWASFQNFSAPDPFVATVENCILLNYVE